MKMNKLIVGIYEEDIHTQTLIKYGLDITLSNIKNINIETKIIYETYNFIENISYIDWIMIKIPYSTYLYHLTNINEYKSILGKFDNIHKFIFIIEHNDYVHNEIFDDKLLELNDVNEYEIKVVHIYYSKALEYLSLIRDDIENVNPQIIDNILKEELGNQKYKKLSPSDKIHEITKLIKDESIVDEWMLKVGFDKFTDIIDEKLINGYNSIVCSHCIKLINEIQTNVSTLNNSTNFDNISENYIQICQISNLIGSLLEAYNIFNSYNNNSNNTFTLFTESEQDFILLNINTFIINTSNNSKVINNSNYLLLKSYLDNLKNYIKTFNIDDLQINQLVIMLMKNKIQLKFDEELFNELKEFNIEMFNTNNDEKFFSECIEIWIKNESNNFYDLIVYTDKTNQQNLTELVIYKFITYVELLEYDEYMTFISDIDLEKLIKSFKIILSPNKINSSNDLLKYNTVIISKLLYIISNVISHKYTNETNGSNKYSLLNQMKYIFDNYVKDNIYYNDNETNLFIHNILWNYTTIIMNTTLNKESQINLIEYEMFIKVHNDFKQLIIILFDFVNVDLTESIKQIENNNITDKEDNKTKDKTEEDGTEEDETEDDDEEDEDEETEDEEEIIEKIYGFIKKSTAGRKMNTLTLKKIAEIYWTKARDYNKSIKLFESDMITKKFTKIYKENNN